MEVLVKQWTGYLATGVEVVAGLIIAFAALQATIRAIPLFLHRTNRQPQIQKTQIETIRLQFGRWLALALEFALGSDILRTALAPTWDDIGQLAAIAAIRIVLNYFLQEEIEKAARHQSDIALQEGTPPAAPLQGTQTITHEANDAIQQRP